MDSTLFKDTDNKPGFRLTRIAKCLFVSVLIFGLHGGNLCQLTAGTGNEVSLEWLRVVEFDHNHPAILTKEVNSLEVQRAIFGANKSEDLPLEVLGARFKVITKDGTSFGQGTTASRLDFWGKTNSSYGTGFACQLVWSLTDSQRNLSEADQKRIAGYLNERLKGHTAGYMLASFKERSQPANGVLPHIAMILRHFPEVPPSLIKPCGIYVSEEPTEAFHQVTDGPILRIYYTNLKQRIATEELLDAQELHEATREIVREAGLEAMRNLEGRGVKRGIGYCHSFWPEKKRILLEKHGIYWRSPQDLSPWSLFD